MALDGVFTRFLANELQNELRGARVSQIHQPNKDELVLNLRTFEGGRKLLISARANSPRVSFTESAPENPASPPMLCMLLRKHGGGHSPIIFETHESSDIQENSSPSRQSGGARMGTNGQS